jgi:2-C-methyl-D-erythritol 4-phosphate cytidylyltransferase
MFALIVAGGKGLRMGSSLPKQFLPLAGRPLLMHSIEAFLEASPDIPVAVVLPGDQMDTWKRLCGEHRFDRPHTLVEGGPTRFQSVKNGLVAFEGDGLVAVHDGARPLIRPETIRRLYSEAAKSGSAIPVIPPKDSLRWEDESGNRVIDRNFVKLIQTPQVFGLEQLKAAYRLPYEVAFTDDATVWEKAGHAVHLTEGQESNIKVTRPGDLLLAEALMAGERRG